MFCGMMECTNDRALSLQMIEASEQWEEHWEHQNNWSIRTMGATEGA